MKRTAEEVSLVFFINEREVIRIFFAADLDQIDSLTYLSDKWDLSIKEGHINLMQKCDHLTMKSS